MPFCLRTDAEFSKVKAWVESQNYGGFCVRETVQGANEHWHWLLLTEKDVKAVRMSFKRKVPELAGNGKYSLTVCLEKEKYERYMCKGESEGEGPEVVWRFGLEYSDEKVEELHAAYWLENRRLKKRKVGSMVDYVIDAAKSKNVHWNDRAALCELYIRELGVRGKPINLFSIRANVNSVQLALCPDDSCLKVLVERCEQY